MSAHEPEATGGQPESVRPELVTPVDLRDYARFDEQGPSRVRVLATDRQAVDLWGLEPRQATSAMRIDGDVSYTVIGGRSWFVTEEGELGLDPMGAILVPAGVVHGFENRSADPLIVLATQSPPGPEPVDDPVDEHGEAIHLARRSRLRRLLDRVLGGDG